ncbi:MAG: sugar-binding domain-containing protein [Pseudomonadota bacterium]
MSRRIKTEQLDHEEQLLVRIAYACEIEGLTQQEAAERLGLTRLRVNKGLSELRQRGILRVSIDSVYTAAAEMEWALRERFDLTRAVVVPSPESPSSLTPLVAAGLGGLLQELLVDPALRRFGMSWGNTLNLSTRHMQPIDRPDLEIVSVMGGVVRGSDVNGYEITTRLADLCNAEHSFFVAPVYADTPKSRKILMEQDGIAQGIRSIQSCDAIALAAGDLKSSLLVRDALPKDIDAADLIAAGGVGDIIGHILDANGELIDHPLNERLIGASLEDVRAMANTILAAGGLNKVPIILASLRAGFVDTLVTDENTAKALLEAA